MNDSKIVVHRRDALKDFCVTRLLANAIGFVGDI